MRDAVSIGEAATMIETWAELNMIRMKILKRATEQLRISPYGSNEDLAAQLGVTQKTLYEARTALWASDPRDEIKSIARRIRIDSWTRKGFVS